MASSRRFRFTVNRAVSHTTGAKLLLDCLLVQGSQVGFGVPGESYLALLDSIYESQESKQDKFNFITTRHEAGAAYMAEAYGKLTNTPGICLVTRGPGACHASIGIHTAHQNSTPMLVFVGQIETSMRHREAFQELDYASVFSSMTKWSIEIDDADRIPELISRAYHISQSGRKGPVVIALPENVLTQKTSVEPCQRIVPTLPYPDSVSIAKTMDLLANAKSPVVLAGGGGWSESGKQSFKNFVESNHLPVVVSFRGQDILDNNSTSYCGEAGFGMPSFVRDTIDNSDLLLAINVRFGEILTDGYKLLDPKNFKKTLIHCHEGIDELGKIFVPDLSICAGPNEVSKLLSEQSALPPTFKSTTESSHQVWLDSLIAPKQPGDLDMSQVMSHLRTKLPKDTIIANGAGNFAIWSGRHILYGDQMRLLAPQSGAMGAGIPAAIAAKLAEPNRFRSLFYRRRRFPNEFTGVRHRPTASSRICHNTN